MSTPESPRTHSTVLRSSSGYPIQPLWPSRSWNTAGAACFTKWILAEHTGSFGPTLFLMLEWDQQFFLDISIPFGLRHGASACQRTTEAVSAIAREEAGADSTPYIDDTIGAALPQAAWAHYHHLLDLMAQLGLEAAPEKCEGPTTIITWIGVVFDTLQLTMAIDPSKVEEARTFCSELLTTNSIPVKKYQTFLGKRH